MTSPTSSTPPAPSASSSPSDDNALALRRKLLDLESLAEAMGGRGASAYKGRLFERLIKYYLETDPVYTSQIGKVWLWSDWPGRDGHDTGIDLVAEDARAPGPDKKFWAIQCKFVSTSADDSEKTLSSQGIDSFLAASGGERFTYRLLATTAHNLTKHTSDKLKDQKTLCSLILRHHLEGSVIDWSTYNLQLGEAHKKERKRLRPYQSVALEAVVAGFKNSTRGKLLMACGTGKTYTALRITERLVQQGGEVLFVVPSIALIGQALREWSRQHDPDKKKMSFFCICSDGTANQFRSEDEPDDATSSLELGFPPTTNAEKLTDQLDRLYHKEDPKTSGSRASRTIKVLFSTYHSLGVIEAYRQKRGGSFALIICDEAHRTAMVEREDATNASRLFTRIHDDAKIRGDRRLYMTATPKIYPDTSESRKQKTDRALRPYSMDDESLYGPTFHKLSFRDAVKKNCLVDYKVLILTSFEDELIDAFNDEDDPTAEDAAKLAGCWNGLAKRVRDLTDDFAPMRRAVAFTHTIKEAEALAKLFNRARPGSGPEGNLYNRIRAYFASRRKGKGRDLALEAHAISSKQTALQRSDLLDLLRAEPPEGTCRILTNARCLSEGVDVPSLDAVLFMKPKESQIEIIQAVGRVMRQAEGKKWGYIILPIFCKRGSTDEDIDKDLDKNESYKTIWKVLKALRSHDEEMDVEIHSLLHGTSSKIIHDHVGIGKGKEPSPTPGDSPEQTEFDLERDKLILNFRKRIMARVIKKCGDTAYWESWAQDIGDLMNNIRQRLQKQLDAAAAPGLPGFRDLTLVPPTVPAALAPAGLRAAWSRFMASLHETINPSITEAQALDLLAQHAVMGRILDALFGQSNFTQHNPVAKSLRHLLQAFELRIVAKELKTLDDIYASVENRVKNITTIEGREEITRELYDKIFKNAFRKESDRLGIVYTPDTIIDYMLHSVDEVLQNEFAGRRLRDNGVHILDPFTGTGTFMARLLANRDLLPDGFLWHKYLQELHANEITLIAYYLAAANIEQIWQARRPNEPYHRFEGIVFTDTFNAFRPGGAPPALGAILDQENTDRANLQREAPIQVIISNPPYSAGQKSQNDDNQNIVYPELRQRIEETYAKHGTATSKKALYDSYVHAIRWSTDRLSPRDGVIALVTNGAFIDSRGFDGFRQCLAGDFAKIYCLNLRGNIRAFNPAEGENVFGQASMSPIAITLFIKKKDHNPDLPAEIWYHDIGEALKRPEKLTRIAEAKHYAGFKWTQITPDAEGNWLNQTSPVFAFWHPLGDKTNLYKKPPLFSLHSMGLNTNRDAWVYGFSKQDLTEKMRAMVEFYNSECDRLRTQFGTLSPEQKKGQLNRDPQKISWSSSLEPGAIADKKQNFDEAGFITTSLYRPFTKMHLYYSRFFNHRVSQQPRMFPVSQGENRAICVSGPGANREFSCLMTDTLPDLELLRLCQSFPLYRYRRAGGGLAAASGGKEALPHGEAARAASGGPANDNRGPLGAEGDRTPGTPEEAQPNETPVRLGPQGELYFRRSALPPETVRLFRAAYDDEALTPEQIFHYIYGVLHHPHYRETYAADLGKKLPHVPLLAEFHAIADIGRALGDLHVNYETLAPHPDVRVVARAGSEAAAAELRAAAAEGGGRAEGGGAPGGARAEGRAGAEAEAGAGADRADAVSLPIATLEAYVAARLASTDTRALDPDRASLYRIEQMKWRSKDKRDVLSYNRHFEVSGIPLESHAYRVNGKPPLDWLVDRYQVKTDKSSRLIHDPNAWLLESGAPLYVLGLIPRLVSLSLETQRLVLSLPAFRVLGEK